MSETTRHERTCSVYVCLHDDADSSHAVERDLEVFVFAPVAHAGHVDAVGVVLLVACDCQIETLKMKRGVFSYLPQERRHGQEMPQA